MLRGLCCFTSFCVTSFIQLCLAETFNLLLLQYSRFWRQDLRETAKTNTKCRTMSCSWFWEDFMMSGLLNVLFLSHNLSKSTAPFNIMLLKKIPLMLSRSDWCCVFLFFLLMLNQENFNLRYLKLIFPESSTWSNILDVRGYWIYAALFVFCLVHETCLKCPYAVRNERIKF